MSWRCVFVGHSLDRIAPLYARCDRCKQAFFTDYFESVAQGRCVRIKVSDAEAARAVAGKSPYSYTPETGGWVR